MPRCLWEGKQVADSLRGMWQPEVGQAIGEWRSALKDLAPKVPFDADKRQAVKVILKDERIANDLFAQRKAFHVQAGLDPITAGKQAAQDLTDLAQRFGR